MNAYINVLRVQGVLRVTASQLLARLPVGMLSLVILLHVEGLTDSYATAGSVVACVTLSEALAVPFTGRLIGVLGVRRTLTAAALVHAVALGLLAVAGDDLPVLLALGVAVGVSVPPVMPAVRALYPQLVPGEGVKALFALDTTAQELNWIVGPVLATVLATSGSTVLAVVVTAGITLTGTLMFVMSPRVKDARIEPGISRFGGVLLQRSVLTAMAATAALIASFTALEVAVVTLYDGDAVSAGVAIAVASGGSLVGGLVWGHRQFDLLRLVTALIVVCLGTAAAGLTTEPLLIGTALFLSGLGFAPALAALYYMVSNVVDPRAATEAFGWMQTALLAGAASGTAVSGAVGESAGPSGSFMVAAVAACLAAVAPMVTRAMGPVPGLHPRVSTTAERPAATDPAR